MSVPADEAPLAAIQRACRNIRVEAGITTYLAERLAAPLRDILHAAQELHDANEHATTLLLEAQAEAQADAGTRIDCEELLDDNHDLGWA